ncbi:hypothetical protein [Mesorhizobium sp. ESP-6-2]|uniref:hypothetical protein n=1 Tax=Mesorhizobium sp. ESP-6-2 TaxID=2876625 RepID=UPI001CCCFD8B|nr:hypothetical protein [Mesorhizobium sp. ESP-6-2]MBZ9807653.1 hypothetical protein [Mesorhizobium sp. ESP-6-2]
MTRSDALILREHLTDIKGWVEHWQTDRLCNLIPTESSLIMAKAHADSALAMIERIEPNWKEAV